MSSTPSQKGSTITRWSLGIVFLGAVILLWPDWKGLTVSDWLLRASLVVVIGMIYNLGVGTSFGKITFLPVGALTAYMVLMPDVSPVVLTAGVVVGALGRLVDARQAIRQRYDNFWDAAEELVLWPLGQNGLSLVTANQVYQFTGHTPPLTAIKDLETITAMIAALGAYLLIYNLLLVLDLRLRQIKVFPSIAKDYRVMFGIQFLPLVTVPLSALVLSGEGLLIFFIFEGILVTIIFIINRLTITQDTLNQQVSQLQTFSAMNRALRTSLETSKLLETAYYQVANLIKVKNLHIVLNQGSEQHPDWYIALAIENGKRVRSRQMPSPMDGFLEKVLKDNVAMVADPVDRKARQFKVSAPTFACRAWMGVPMMSAKSIMGAMVTWLTDDQQPERILDNDDLDMFAAIAAQTSVALENARLFESAQKQANQLARLNQIGTVINASLNPERVMETITESVIEVAGCDKAVVYLLQASGGEDVLVLTHAQGFDPAYLIALKDAKIIISEAERKKVIEDGSPLIIPNIKESTAGIPPGNVLLASQADYDSYAYFPLRAQKRSIGLLAVYYQQPHYYTGSEVELLASFANQAALAIINAQIYRRVDVQLTRHVEQTIQMADINSRLSSTLDLETIFDLIIDSAMEGCSADAGVLILAEDPELGEKTTGGLNMVAWRGFNLEIHSRAPHQVAEELADSILESGEMRLTTIDDPDDIHSPYSQLSVPIMVENRAIGAIALETHTLNSFTDDDITFVNQLAVQAAVAIRNAQLYRRAQITRDRLHAILDASNDGLLMIDPQSRIVMTNTRMGDFWDFARQDFSQRTPDQFLADPLTALGEGLGYREGELKNLLIEGGNSPSMQARTDIYTVRNTPRPRFIERMVAPVYDEFDHFIGLMLVFRDITEQKELERAREDLSNMIVHDLRAPLQAVMGGMRLIQARSGEGDEIIQQATDVSGRAVKKLLNLVNNLLDLSRMEDGELATDQEPVDLRAIIQDAADELKPLAQEVKAVFKVDVPDGLPYAYIDRDMIERVLLNLVDNALKYAPPGSLVTIQAAHDADRHSLKVQVSDNGPGIPDEYKDKIFGRYTQVPSQKRRRRSAGLGLAFCKMAVEAHQGRIWVDDNPGGGSIFSFTIPAARIPARAENGGSAAKKEQEKASPVKTEQAPASSDDQAEPSPSPGSPPGSAGAAPDKADGSTPETPA